jgi:MFS superfamily sulfate permease-like transporter
MPHFGSALPCPWRNILLFYYSRRASDKTIVITALIMPFFSIPAGVGFAISLSNIEFNRGPLLPQAYN